MTNEQINNSCIQIHVIRGRGKHLKNLLLTHNYSKLAIYNCIERFVTCEWSSIRSRGSHHVLSIYAHRAVTVVFQVRDSNLTLRDSNFAVLHRPSQHKETIWILEH